MTSGDSFYGYFRAAQKNVGDTYGVKSFFSGNCTVITEGPVTIKGPVIIVESRKTFWGQSCNKKNSEGEDKDISLFRLTKDGNELEMVSVDSWNVCESGHAVTWYIRSHDEIPPPRAGAKGEH